MSARRDGMPEGHPEQLPVKIAALTIYASGTDPEAPDFQIYGELVVEGNVVGRMESTTDQQEIVAGVRDLMINTLRTDNTTTLETTCGCGRCHGGGDAS